MFKASLRFWNFLMDVVGNTPKPPALPAAPHPDIYSIFLAFCVEVGQTVVKRKIHAFLSFLKTSKVRTDKGFSVLSHFYGYNC